MATSSRGKGVTLAVAAVFVLLAGGWAWWSYASYRSWAVPFEQPEQLTIRGRHFLGPADRTISRAQLDASSGSAFHRNGAVDLTPIPHWRTAPVWISTTADGCPTGAALEVSPGRFIGYALSGSC